MNKRLWQYIEVDTYLAFGQILQSLGPEGQFLVGGGVEAERWAEASRRDDLYTTIFPRSLLVEFFNVADRLLEFFQGRPKNLHFLHPWEVPLGLRLLCGWFANFHRWPYLPGSPCSCFTIGLVIIYCFEQTPKFLGLDFVLIVSFDISLLLKVCYRAPTTD